MKKRVSEWLRFAEEDLRVAQLCYKEGIYNQSCFHAQQCAEKALKAIVEKDGKVPKLHHLIDLLEIVLKTVQLRFEVNREGFEFLDKFYTITRYPFIVGMLPDGVPGKEDANKAIALAQQIHTETVNYLS